MSTPRVLLGIETSPDETAAALMVDGRVVADRITRQVLHEAFGGVVPELASRAHEQLLLPAIRGVLKDAGREIDEVEGVAVTCGPGLAGALLVGVAVAKGLAAVRGIPLYGVNHLEGHLWSAELSQGAMPLPFLALIVSGGHTLLVGVKGFGNYELIAATRDDAVGELFDKVGRMLGFSFPAGAAIDREALAATKAVRFPRARFDGDAPAFSFSGLKTAVLLHLKAMQLARPENLPPDVRGAICRGVMEAVAAMLERPLQRTLESGKYRALVMAGGVAASRFLRARLESLASASGVPFIKPLFEHCTDNGAMIAWAGSKMIAGGLPPAPPDLEVRPSYPIAYGRGR